LSGLADDVPAFTINKACASGLQAIVSGAQSVRLRPVFRDDGTITAGNASAITDGAAAIVVLSKEAALRHAVAPQAALLGCVSVAVDPARMGIGPVPAVRKLLARHSLAPDQMDVIELNEAFAAQGLACMRELGLKDDDPRVNPNGGAIALGHPLGASGARLITTALNQLEAISGRYALCTMCIGVGQGIALIIERA